MSQIFDYEIPYHIFTGVWAGVQTHYTPQGNFKGVDSFKVAIYWEKPHTLLHFRQDPIEARALAQKLGLSSTVSRLTTYEFDLQIKGKYATGGGVSGVKNEGAETTPDTYIFHITANKHSWFNNQHCPTANERRVIGPQIDANGVVEELISQHLTRVSYEVPPHFRRALLLE
jgi:hypothetical protein